jgi:lipid II:glycine glycyltransferase (peptidoglycan interpeptide bridge formation enzyme)
VKCDYFLWHNLEICVYSQRVVSRLRKWHKSLKAEWEVSGTKISDEVNKYKCEAERCKNEVDKCRNEADKCRNEAKKCKSKLGRQKMKFRLVERKYQFALVCSWVIFLLLLVYPSSHRVCNASRIMLQ